MNYYDYSWLGDWRWIWTALAIAFVILLVALFIETFVKNKQKNLEDCKTDYLLYLQTRDEVDENNNLGFINNDLL